MGNTVSVKLAPAECSLAISTITKMEGFNRMEMERRGDWWNNSVRNAAKSNTIIHTAAKCITRTGPIIAHSAETTSCTTVTTVVFYKDKKKGKKRKKDNKLNSVPAQSLRVGRVKFNPLFSTC